MTTELTGTYLTLDDGRPAVRFSRVYDHPVERVWQFVTEADHLAAWFPFRARIELCPGGAVTFPDDPDMADHPGTVIAVDPHRHLSYAWDGDELHFDLEEIDDKRTRFTLTNVLAAEDTAARTSAGWEMCLQALDAKARGERYEEPHAGVTAPWKGVYDAYVAAGFPSGAPVPGPGA
ncbi:SRPBCC family protein [Streptomyces sp. YU58]|uniref:SRPBCC family protein n=1 Tax=Streptomyces sp. SX92 TaxID=3158972 RepID=UPI0027B98AFF|nr:SRPBCC family protein [Streptomyces coralus]WLW49962.1 SRPBCC family protein [Streptomyces coralus]